MSLFSPTRTCVCCGHCAEVARGPRANQPAARRMLSLNTILYRRGASRRRQTAAPAVHVCEPCYLLAAAGPESAEAVKLGSHLVRTTADAYNRAIRHEGAHA